MAKYSVLIPVYNEEKILEKNTIRIYNFLKKAGYDFELFLINDSSKDRSLEIANKLAKIHPEIRVISYSNGPSRRENLFWSFPKTSGDVIAFTDLDLAVSEKYFPKLFSELERNNSDMCIGSRYESDSVVHRELMRKIVSIAYLKTVQLLFRCPISDFQCGFKAFRRRKLLKILKECGYDKSFQRGWFFDAELIIRAYRNGMKITTIPVVWNRGKQSAFKITRELKVIPYMLNLFWRL